MHKSILVGISAATLITTPVSAGDPVPGLNLALELNTTGGREVPALTFDVDRAAIPADARGELAGRVSENVRDALSAGRVRATEAEQAFVARRVAELARTIPGEVTPRSIRYCFESWCADVTVDDSAEPPREAVRAVPVDDNRDQRREAGRN